MGVFSREDAGQWEVTLWAEGLGRTTQLQNKWELHSGTGHKGVSGPERLPPASGTTKL